MVCLTNSVEKCSRTFAKEFSTTVCTGTTTYRIPWLWYSISWGHVWWRGPYLTRRCDAWLTRFYNTRSIPAVAFLARFSNRFPTDSPVNIRSNCRRTHTFTWPTTRSTKTNVRNTAFTWTPIACCGSKSTIGSFWTTKKSNWPSNESVSERGPSSAASCGDPVQGDNTTLPRSMSFKTNRPCETARFRFRVVWKRSKAFFAGVSLCTGFASAEQRLDTAFAEYTRVHIRNRRGGGVLRGQARRLLGIGESGEHTRDIEWHDGAHRTGRGGHPYGDPVESRRHRDSRRAERRLHRRRQTFPV